MNKYVAGGFLAFAFGVAAVTQVYLEAFPKPLAQKVNDALSGKATEKKIEEMEVAAPAKLETTKPTRLKNYDEAAPKLR